MENMRKLMLLVVLIGALFLSGCDIFYEGVDNIWYDEGNETLNISYSISRPSKDEETGEYPIETIHLLVRYENSTEWVEVIELDDYSATDLQIPYRFEQFGNVELKIERRDETGNLVESSEIFNVWINEPQYIYHFDTYFDSWSGEVRFNFGLNEMSVYTITIQKSNDGGLNWVDVISNKAVKDELGNALYELKYYEYEEGNYAYRIQAFREDGSLLDDMNGWGEINVSYDEKQFEGDPAIWYVSSSIDPWSKTIYIWWDASGDFEKFVIEKSTDLENWEAIGEVPRIGSNFEYLEEVDGEYFYRVNAVTGEEFITNYVSEESLRVKDGIIIGYMNGWVEWDTQSIYLDWEFYDETVAQVTVERKVDDGEFELIGEFGGLKKSHTDEALMPGTYVYRISVLNEFGEILDQVESKEYTIEQVNHVYHLNAWHNAQTGKIEFNFGFNQNYVTRYVIEKSSDGGLTWEVYVDNQVEYTEYNWYVDQIKVYELTEGIYAYRLTGYDSAGMNLGTVYGYNEVVVQYNYLNYDEPTDVYYIDGNYNIYDNTLNLWWNSQGMYETHLIEYSSDGINWTEALALPRISTYANLENLPDGTYYFRISAVDNTGTVLDTQDCTYTIRIKHDALIGSFNVWYDYSSEQVQLNWDVLRDNVATIRIERRLETESTYTLVGDFGPLKTTIFDAPTVTENYVYKLTLLDTTGTVLDEIESNTIYFEINTTE